MSQIMTLKKSNCKNCYKCIRNCPVKSIRFSGNQAHIIENECILCGNCFVVCPQNAKEIVKDTEKVIVMMQSGAPVIASIAPAFAANYGTGINAMKEALLKLGFADVQETAYGATIVKTEYENLLKDEQRDIVISSCCHTVNLLIQKYFPDLIYCLADVVTPMQAHCMKIKQQNPEAKVVFIGPCISKKDEAQESDDIDAVLTFEELSEWLKKSNIELKKEMDSNECSRTRFFPTSGGILKTMKKDQSDYTYLVVDGIENCINALKEIKAGNIHKCFIEMSACTGSCIGGPVMERTNRSTVSDYITIKKYAGEKDFAIAEYETREMKKYFSQLDTGERIPSDSELREILLQMGKIKPSDELNCGSCGYNTCREKAIAVYQGKAEISMCLPFLKDKTESFSNSIFNNTPNGIIVLNEKLEVQNINSAASKIVNLRWESDILGDHVVRILEPDVFLEVLETGINVHDKKVFLAEYKKYVEQSVIYDKEYHIIICIMRDISEEENEREKKEAIRRQTVEVADKVVDKQMRIVQEIASLLGETAAETKIALTKLKETTTHE